MSSIFFDTYQCVVHSMMNATSGSTCKDPESCLYLDDNNDYSLPLKAVLMSVITVAISCLFKTFCKKNTRLKGLEQEADQKQEERPTSKNWECISGNLNRSELLGFKYLPTEKPVQFPDIEPTIGLLNAFRRLGPKNVQSVLYAQKFQPHPLGTIAEIFKMTVSDWSIISDNQKGLFSIRLWDAKILVPTPPLIQEIYNRLDASNSVSLQISSEIKEGDSLRNFVQGFINGDDCTLHRNKYLHDLFYHVMPILHLMSNHPQEYKRIISSIRGYLNTILPIVDKKYKAESVENRMLLTLLSMVVDQTTSPRSIRALESSLAAVRSNYLMMYLHTNNPEEPISDIRAQFFCKLFNKKIQKHITQKRFPVELLKADFPEPINTHEKLLQALNSYENLERIQFLSRISMIYLKSLVQSLLQDSEGIRWSNWDSFN